MSFHYYGLVASLPHLSNDFTPSRLPISRNSLKARLANLPLEDREELWVIVNFHEDLYSITAYDDVQVVRMIEVARRHLTHPQIQALFETDTDILVIVAALRQRLVGKKAALPSGGVSSHIRRHWQTSDFGLSRGRPWVANAYEYLSRGQILELEQLVDQIRWNQAVALTQNNPFSLEAVAAYLGKWDILYRWSRVSSAAGRERFDQLITEILQTA